MKLNPARAAHLASLATQKLCDQARGQEVCAPLLHAMMNAAHDFCTGLRFPHRSMPSDSIGEQNTAPRVTHEVDNMSTSRDRWRAQAGDSLSGRRCKRKRRENVVLLGRASF